MARSAHAPTIYDVARLAGVSHATVSYVLSGRRGGASRISAETRERVEAATAELGYSPNGSARNLRRQRTDRVCLLISRLGSPYVDAMANGIHEAVAAHGLFTVIAVGGSPAREAAVLDQLHRRLADGAIIDAPSIGGAALARLARRHVALVALSNHVAPDGFDVVRTGEAAACDEAMRHLFAQGHRRIGFLRHRTDPTTPDLREASYRRAHHERGIPVDEALVRLGADERQDAFAHTAALLALTDRPTAIFSSSDIGAISAMRAIETAGLRVPEDVAVIGVGNIPEGAMGKPSLTSVGPETSDFAANTSAIAALVLSRMAGEAPATGRLLTQPWAFIRRASG